MFFFFKQKTAYEMRISDWSSDVCSSDLAYENRATNVELQRLFPALRLCQIESKASHVGAVRRKAPLVTFDIPALDAIRARSVEMGLLLAELDERAGTQRFFQKSCRRPALKHIVRAATFLGGDVMIEWYYQDCSPGRNLEPFPTPLSLIGDRERLV